MPGGINREIPWMFSVYGNILFVGEPAVFSDGINSQGIGYPAVAGIKKFPIGANVNIRTAGISVKAFWGAPDALKWSESARMLIIMKGINGAGHFGDQVNQRPG